MPASSAKTAARCARPRSHAVSSHTSAPVLPYANDAYRIVQASIPTSSVRFTPTRVALEIVRKHQKYVEVTYDLDAQRFDEVRRIVHIIFGVQG